MLATPQRAFHRRSSAGLLGALGLLFLVTVVPAVAVAAPDTLSGMRATAADAVLPPAYWQGGPGRNATVLITASNPGGAAGDLRGSYTLPAGVRPVSTTGTAGCTHQRGQEFRCTFAAGVRSGTIIVQVAVDADGWRRAPLTGTVSVSAGGTLVDDSYFLVLPPGPPTPGISTAVSDATLPAVAPAPPEPTTMTAHITNTAGAAAAGAFEIVTPDGVDLETFPPACIAHRQLAPNRDRCDIGMIDDGAAASMTFGLRVVGPARDDAPLVGVVYGMLTPTGREVLTTQANYRVLVAGEEPPAPAGDRPAAPSINEPAAGDRRVAVRQDGVFGGPLNATVIVGSLVGLFALAGVVVVLSLRRRLVDPRDPEPSRSHGKRLSHHEPPGS